MAPPTPSTLILTDHSIVADPQTLPILQLHRHQDGYISLAASEGDDFRPVVAIRRDEFEDCFPKFRERFGKDSYVSINSSYQLRNYSERGKAHGYPKHDSRSLRHLCACYADLDFYQCGLSLGSVLGTIVEYQKEHKIPPASILVSSGRGLWVLWLIHRADDPNLSQRAFPERIQLYAKIQRAIHHGLATIGADAWDTARYIRVPGSFSTKSERVVEWWIQGRSGGAISYTLDEPAGAFGVDPVPDKPIRLTIQQPVHRNANKRRGLEALNAGRLREFELLRSIRGGFVRGHRNRAAMIFAWLLNLNGTSRQRAEQLLEEFAAECKPALLPSETRKALTTGYGSKITKMMNQTIADWLEVNVEEAALLEKLPPASRYRLEAASEEEPRRAKPPERHRAILKIVSQLGRVPPMREMAEILTERGHPIQHVTVCQDYKELGLSSRKSRTESTRTRGIVR